MNRPNYKEYLNQYDYVHDLEKYCDTIEQSNKSLSNALDDCMKTNHYLESELEKYKKVCEQEQ